MPCLAPIPRRQHGREGVMVENVIWWIGVIHLAIYTAAGFSVAATWLVWRVHAHFSLMGIILKWHFADKPAPPASRG